MDGSLERERVYLLLGDGQFTLPRVWRLAVDDILALPVATYAAPLAISGEIHVSRTLLARTTS